jgi:hypothetical protein
VVFQQDETKTHLAYVKERRTEAEATKILENAIKKLQGED